MKVLDIAFKDLLRSFRSLVAVGMMFGAPLLITGLIALAFGGFSGGQTELAATRVLVVDRDQPDSTTGLAAGQTLVSALQDPGLSSLLEVEVVADESTARAAVDRRAAGVAVLIPEGFTRAALQPQGQARVSLYSDPALTIGPGIVRAVVSEVLDAFTGGKVTASLMIEQLSQRGQPVDAAQVQAAALQYGEWAQQVGGQGGSLLEVHAPAGAGSSANESGNLIGPIMAGMLVFFLFYGGASTAESILQEDEEGTLARLFTTPTARAVILGGKFTSVFVVIAVQALVLVVVSALLFHISWGQPAAVILMVGGLLVAAAGFGVFLISFLKTTRQAGAVLGGVVTMTGMAGGLFTTGIQNLPPAYEIVTLLTPQGWALRGLKLALSGAGVTEVIGPTLVLLGIGAVLFSVGVLIFRKRFA